MVATPTEKLSAVADFMIEISYAEEKPITHLKLQKLVYYAQARAMVLMGGVDKALFQEDFQAWINGPVIPELYGRFASSGSTTIPNIKCNVSLFSATEKEVLTKVREAYGGLDARSLVNLTHTEAPRIEARKDLATNDIAPSSEIISKDSMYSYYMKQK